MNRSFFQHLDRHGVRYLVVSGQASILYGAATFSEDLDLWVAPEEESFARLTAALRAARATYYKLTPALSVELARRHHGFHFVVPDPAPGAPLFLDVMGCPPRVGDFGSAEARARLFQTAWGVLPTVGIPDLVELKKTQRPRDYPIIGRLVLARLRELGDQLTDADADWAARNVFGLPELQRLLTEHPATHAALTRRDPALAQAVAILASQSSLPVALEDALDAYFETRMAPLRRADRQLWRPVIEELRALRAQGALMPEGAPV